MKLTTRQTQVIELAMQGVPNKEIAQRLSVAYNTVRVHRVNLLRKMKAKSMAQAVAIYMEAK